MRFVSLDGSGESNPTEKGDPANKVVKWVMPGSLYATSKEQSPPSQIGCCRWRARSQAYSLLSISIVLLLSGFSFTCFIGAGINGGFSVWPLFSQGKSPELVIRFPLGYQSAQQKSSRAML
ncbi:hypothetical protein OIU78_025399 [Salix suchowensis]|nr:hypothetical protein OIU78_025399 [Salix suchowensis]